MSTVSAPPRRAAKSGLPTEAALLAVVARSSKVMWRGCRVGREVKSHGRARTDLMVLWEGELIAIEGKVRHWQRALGQALLNRYCADRSYVALWGRYAHDEVLREAAAWGVGVIRVEGKEALIALAAPLGVPEGHLRKRMVAAVAGVKGKR